MEPHDPGEPIAALQGRMPIEGRRRGEWSPAAKLGIGLTGTTLASVGMVRHDRFGMVLGGVGLALMLRAVSDVGIERLFAPGLEPRSRQAESGEGVSIPIQFGPRPEGQREPSSGPPRTGGTDPGRVH